MSGPSLIESRGVEPTPYDLYIRLAPLVSSWPQAAEWPGEVVAACGFQAAELTLRLLDDALADARPAAFPQRRVARYAEHLIDGVELICRLLRQLLAPPSSICQCSSEPPPSRPSPGFAVLARLEGEQLDVVTGRLTLAMGRLSFEIGVEDQLRSSRRENGLPSLEGGSPRARDRDIPVMDYRAVVSPDLVYGFDILPLTVQAGQLLDQMVLADYHPLRVRLRDGSGAQSSAARRLGPAIREAAACLWTALDGANLLLLELLQRPSEHIELLVWSPSNGSRIGATGMLQRLPPVRLTPISPAFGQRPH